MKDWPWPIVPRRSHRKWVSNWTTNRDCVCSNAEERVLEPDGSCWACGGRVVKRSPFNPGDWSRE